jgi:hypothetical protein
MNQFTFSRGIGLCIGTATLLGAVLSGCGSSDGIEPSMVAESEAALRAPRLCDGPLKLPCATGQYCNAIATSRCPGPRQIGVCAAKPQVCSDLFAPVCGCDDHTYPNACNAAAVGVAVVHDGACAPAQIACGGIAARPCPGTGKCVDDPSDDCDPANGGADCGGICTCVQTQLCIRGSHFDSAPAVCACVPDVPTDKCAAVTCLTGQVCCPSCGVCQPQGLACNKTGCTN